MITRNVNHGLRLRHRYLARFRDFRVAGISRFGRAAMTERKMAFIESAE
jgi:hypothetical protein